MRNKKFNFFFLNDSLEKKMYIIIKIIWGELNIFKDMYKK